MAKVELHQWYRQFLKLKAQASDAILFFRFGDFYETFDDDAKLIAELLDVTLTRKDYAVDRSKPKDQQKLYAPMAGMPYHAVERYVSDLVNRGYRIAIAEQLSETESSRTDTRPRSVFAGGIEQIEGGGKMVHREIVRVITPGTLVDPALLPAGKNNYLAAVIAEGGRIGLAYADLSTGEFCATEMAGERAAIQLEGELARLQAAEVLVPDDESLRLPGLAPSAARLTQDLAPMTKDEREHLLPHERIARRLERESQARWAHGHVTTLPVWRWDAATSRDALIQQLRVQSLASFGLDQRPLALRAAGAAIQYIHETQRNSAAQITGLRVYTTGSFMFLDPQTRRNLELLESTSGRGKGTLVSVLDRTRTPMGARLLRRWISQPLLDLDALRVRHDAVACCVEDTVLRAELRQALGEVGDMERAVNRLIQGTTVAAPRDLVNLRQALRALPAVVAASGPQLGLLCRQEQEPGAGSRACPERSRREPGAGSREARRRGPAPRVAGDELFDDEEEQGTENREQGTGNRGQGTGDREQGTGNREQGTGNRGQGTGDREQGTGNRGQGTGDREQGVDHEDAVPGSLFPVLDPCADVLALLERALDDDPPALLGASNYLRADEGGERPRRVIRPGYYREMDELVRANRDAQGFIDGLEARERAKTGIKNLRVSYNNVFGYFIEVSRSDADRVPAHYERKQTLVGAERYITAELKRYEEVVNRAKLRLVELEREAFAQLCEAAAGHAERLLAAARHVARIDAYAALAEAAVRGRYVRPALNDSTRLTIRGGRHPVVEQALDEAFVPNDAEMDTERAQLLIITGPNMAGKSSYLRQVALIVLMAQIGSFVPADSAEVGLADRIFTRIGAQDDIATGQSTFMVEMTETAALLAQGSRRSLIILDEVGRGTSTYDGMAIARAVVEYIHNEPRLQCRTLFATHYHELTALDKLLPRVRNYHMAAVEQEGQVVFLHELRPGGADRSYGIHVAELAGIPRLVIRRARELLAEYEQRSQNGRETGRPEDQEIGRPEPADRSRPAPAQAARRAHSEAQLSLFDTAPGPVVEYLRRLNINELTPLEALTKLYELQKLAKGDP